MTPADEYLLELARQADVTIEYGRMPTGVDGEYIHDRSLIHLRAGMGDRRHRSVLAHELGHAAFADQPTPFGPVHAKQERRAEEWGALRLITVEDYRHVERIHDGHLGAMALDLGVMRSTVEAFARVLLRIDDTVYLRPREGKGQWAHRERVTA